MERGIEKLRRPRRRPWGCARASGSPPPHPRALEVNLLTEDNLRATTPRSGHVRAAGGPGACGSTGRRRKRAATVLHARLPPGHPQVDPDPAWALTRIGDGAGGVRRQGKPLLHSCAYVAFQELAARVSPATPAAAGRCRRREIARPVRDRRGAPHIISTRVLVRARSGVARGPSLRAIADEVADWRSGRVWSTVRRKAIQIAQAGGTTCASTTTNIIMPLVRRWRFRDRGSGRAGRTGTSRPRSSSQDARRSSNPVRGAAGRGGGRPLPLARTRVRDAHAGRRLLPSRTRIVHMSAGFDFLGYADAPTMPMRCLRFLRSLM